MFLCGSSVGKERLEDFLWSGEGNGPLPAEGQWLIQGDSQQHATSILVICLPSVSIMECVSVRQDDYRRDQPLDEEVVSLHHSLAEQAAEYTKKPHVLRLQTADWRVLLFQAS